LSSLTISSLSKEFGNTRVVADLNLNVATGEMLVLVGPSGCGKTTTLRCIAGLESPSAGTIRIGDRLVTAIDEGINLPPEQREIGMVFQSYAVWPHMTVFDNVAYPLRAIGWPSVIPRRSAAASSSASPLRAVWLRRQSYCSLTSHCPIWMPASG
jgi:iron(III) transport system ATP-binding protein